MKRPTLILILVAAAILIVVVVTVPTVVILKKKQQQGSSLVRGTNRTNLTSYNVMSHDNTSPGALVTAKVGKRFVANVNICAVHETSDWPSLKYAYVDITYNNKTARFLVADTCADRDCGGCCTRNRNANGIRMLFDLDSSAVNRVWGIKNAENTFSKTGTYAIVGRLSESQYKSLLKKYGSKFDG